jgi:hypothetical protein
MTGNAESERVRITELMCLVLLGSIVDGVPRNELLWLKHLGHVAGMSTRDTQAAGGECFVPTETALC